MTILLPSGPGRVGARKPHSHGTLASHQLFLLDIGVRSLGLSVQAVPPTMGLVLLQKHDLGFPSACPAQGGIPSHSTAGFLGRVWLGGLQAASPCPKQLSGFRCPKALVLLAEGKAVSSGSVQTDRARVEKVQRRVREITLMPGNVPNPLKVCRNKDEGNFLQMLKHLLVTYPVLKGG